MAELTPHEQIVLEMLGPELMEAVVDARDRLTDNTIMARVSECLVSVERGDPAEVVAEGLSAAQAVAHLAALA